MLRHHKPIEENPQHETLTSAATHTSILENKSITHGLKRKVNSLRPTTHFSTSSLSKDFTS